MGYLTKLKNASTVDSQRIKTFYDSWLKPLYNHDPNLVAYLFMLARDPDYAIPADTQDWFVKSGFLEEDGSLDDDFRNVILSAVTIDSDASTLTIERPEITPPGASRSTR